MLLVKFKFILSEDVFEISQAIYNVTQLITVGLYLKHLPVTLLWLLLHLYALLWVVLLHLIYVYAVFYRFVRFNAPRIYIVNCHKEARNLSVLRKVTLYIFLDILTNLFLLPFDTLLSLPLAPSEDSRARY